MKKFNKKSLLTLFLLPSELIFANAIFACSSSFLAHTDSRMVWVNAKAGVDWNGMNGRIELGLIWWQFLMIPDWRSAFFHLFQFVYFIIIIFCLHTTIEIVWLDWEVKKCFHHQRKEA